MSFRIASYNVYKGGKNGFEKITTATNEIKPDLIGVLEANGWGDNNNATLSAFSKETNLPFHYFSKANTAYNIATLARFEPQTIECRNEHFWHTTLLSVFETQELGQIAILFAHLNPHHESDRVQEIEHILTLLKPYKNAIIMGDLNSLSPHDPYNRAALLSTFQSHAITKFGSEQLVFETITTLESQKYFDVAVTKNYFETTAPTQANNDPAHAVPLRIDYAFVTKPLLSYIQSIHVAKGDSFEIASDHYPLILDLNLTIQA